MPVVLRLCHVFSLFVASLPGLAFGQDTPVPNVDALAPAYPSPVARLWLAHMLFARGIADQDGLTVMAAAHLAAAVPQVPGPPLTKVTEGIAAQVEIGSGAAGPISVTDMLATARDLAKGDDTALTLIDRAEEAGANGRTDIAVSYNAKLAPDQTDIWTLPLYGGAYTEIAVIGDGGSNLDLRIIDDQGQEVCRESAPQDIAFCAFVPAVNGHFKVLVKNPGRAQNAYLLLTN